MRISRKKRLSQIARNQLRGCGTVFSLYHFREYFLVDFLVHKTTNILVKCHLVFTNDFETSKFVKAFSLKSYTYSTSIYLFSFDSCEVLPVGTHRDLHWGRSRRFHRYSMATTRVIGHWINTTALEQQSRWISSEI